MSTHLKRIDLDNKNLFPEILNTNLIDALQRAGILDGKNYWWDGKVDKIKALVDPGINPDTPWVHPAQDPNRRCHKYRMIEQVFKFIPTRCLGCWKVVVRPRTVFELFQLYNLQVDMNAKKDMPCKCGTETDRKWVSALYGGYFYTDSEKQGQARKKEVKEAIAEHIDPDISVILKRFCTEFEYHHGDSKGYNQPKGAKKWEDLMDKYFETPSKYCHQNEAIVKHVQQGWIEFAHQHNDFSYMRFNNDEPLYSKIREY